MTMHQKCKNVGKKGGSRGVVRANRRGGTTPGETIFTQVTPTPKLEWKLLGGINLKGSKMGEKREQAGIPRGQKKGGVQGCH